MKTLKQQFWEKISNKIRTFFITFARGKRDISTTREILGSGNREIWCNGL